MINGGVDALVDGIFFLRSMRVLFPGFFAPGVGAGLRRLRRWSGLCEFEIVLYPGKEGDKRGGKALFRERAGASGGIVGTCGT